jgi:hypothetical protein
MSIPVDEKFFRGFNTLAKASNMSALFDTIVALGGIFSSSNILLPRL